MNNAKLSQEELTQAISNMTGNEMEDLLLELQSTPFWPAILKYNGDRMEMAKNALLSVNAYKEPERVSQTQGIIAGLSDLYAAVHEIEKRRQNNAAKEEEKTQAGK